MSSTGKPHKHHKHWYDKDGDDSSASSTSKEQERAASRKHGEAQHGAPSHTSDPTAALQPPGHPAPPVVRDAPTASEPSVDAGGSKPSLRKRAASAFKNLLHGDRHPPASAAAPPSAVTGLPAADAAPVPALASASDEGTPSAAAAPVAGSATAASGPPGQPATAEPTSSRAAPGAGVGDSEGKKDDTEAVGDDEERKEAESMELLLKQVLKERADAGVSVYILVWQEPPFTIALSSGVCARLFAHGMQRSTLSEGLAGCQSTEVHGDSTSVRL